jgi:hypothetical protein
MPGFIEAYLGAFSSSLAIGNDQSQFSSSAGRHVRQRPVMPCNRTARASDEEPLTGARLAAGGGLAACQVSALQQVARY